MQRVDYSTEFAPLAYKCGSCGKRNRKLWREYNTFLDHQTLLCGKCACEGTEYEFSRIRPDGKYDHKDLGPCDSFSWRVPAVPTEDGDTFWGYTSVPQDGVDWWRRLPLGD